MTNRVTSLLGFFGLLITGLAMLWPSDSTNPIQRTMNDMPVAQSQQDEDLSITEPRVNASEVSVRIAPAGGMIPNKLSVNGDLQQLHRGSLIQFELDNRVNEFRIERVDQSTGITSLRALGSDNSTVERLRMTLGAGEAVGTVSTAVGVYELNGSLESLTYVRVSDLLRLKAGEDYKLRSAPKALAAEPKQPTLGAP